MWQYLQFGVLIFVRDEVMIILDLLCIYIQYVLKSLALQEK